jgi:hypothetical protein
MADTFNLTPQAVAFWLKSGLNRATLHNQGWKQANQRFYGITRAARPFIQEHFKTPEEQAAAFDGLTLALLTIGHFEDIEMLSALYAIQKPTAKPSSTRPKKRIQ